MSTEILQFVSQYSLYSGCITFSLGIIGNTLNILVFTQLKLFRHNRCAFYLTAESISNFFYQILSISLTILTLIYGDDATGRSSIWCKIRYILGQTYVLITLYTICLAAADEFFSTNYRFNLRQICTFNLARCLTFIIFCVCTAHSIVFSLFFNIQPSLGCVISNPVWLQYSTYFFYPVLAGLLPSTIASFFSILAYRNVRRIVRRQIPIVRRRLDQQITAMVLMRVIFCVSLIAPYACYRIYITNFPLTRTKPLEFAIGRLIQVIFVSFVALNYSASFYLFLISSSRFRRQVKFFLIKKCWKKWKSYWFFGNNEVAPETAASHVTNMELEDVD